MANAPIGMILAAGFGTRLYPLSSLRPKPIMEIGTKPVIYLLIKMMENAGIKDIIINLHHEGHQVEKALAQFPLNARIHFVYEKTILGTAGGITNALRTLEISNCPMVLMHGDILCDIDLKPYLDTKDFCTLICDQDREVSGYRGSVYVDNAGNIVELGKFFWREGVRAQRGFFTGVHFLSADAVARIKESQHNSLVAEIYPLWLLEGLPIKGLVKPLIYEDLGSPERIFAANMAIVRDPMQYGHLDFTENLMPQSFASNVFIGTGVVASKSARILGPAFIGSNVHIDDNAVVGPYAVIGDEVFINSNSLVQNSVIMSKTTIEKDERVNCAIGLNSARVKVLT